VLRVRTHTQTEDHSKAGLAVQWRFRRSASPPMDDFARFFDHSLDLNGIAKPEPLFRKKGFEQRGHLQLFALS